MVGKYQSANSFSALGLPIFHGEKIMSVQKENLYVKVKDMAGNEFVCPIDALKKQAELSESDLENCVDDATVKRYAGNIRIKE